MKCLPGSWSAYPSTSMAARVSSFGASGCSNRLAEAPAVVIGRRDHPDSPSRMIGPYLDRRLGDSTPYFSGYHSRTRI